MIDTNNKLCGKLERIKIMEFANTVQPHLTVTSLLKSRHHYGHPCSVPNCTPQCKLTPCNTVTSPLRSLLPRHVDVRNTEVPLYALNVAQTKLESLSLLSSVFFQECLCLSWPPSLYTIFKGRSKYCFKYRNTINNWSC